MPPKKNAKDDLLKEDSPYSHVSFRVKVIAEFEAREDIGILVEWPGTSDSIAQGATQALAAPKVIDCGELYTLDILTGEDPPVTVVAEADPKKPDPKKAAPAKDKKKGEATLELGKKYKGFYEYSEEDIRIDEAWARGVCSRLYKVAICNTDEMKVIHEAKIDFSRVLMHQLEEQQQPGQIKYSICYEENIVLSESSTPWLDRVTIRVECNKTLLKPQFKWMLNPLMLGVEDIENLWVNPDRHTEPLMVRYDLLGTGSFIETPRVPAKSNIRLGSKHVFLLGLEPQINLKEFLESRRIDIEVHDRDEIKRDNLRKSLPYFDLKEPEPLEPEDDDPKKKKKPGAAAAAPKKPEPAKKKDDGKKDPKKKKDKKKDYTFEDFVGLPAVEYYLQEHGLSRVSFKDLLNAYSLKYEVVGQVVPRRVFLDEDKDSLQLNTTARRVTRDITKCTDYFGSQTYVRLSLTLSFPLDRYKPEEKKKVEEVVAPTAAKGTAAAPAKGAKAGAPAAVVEEEKPKPEPTERELLLKSQKLPVVSEVQPFERAVYVFEYKNREFLKVLQQALVEINLKGLGIVNGSERDVRTRKLTAAERESTVLDYISGVEFMDRYHRVFVVEGLSEGGMHLLEEKVPRTQPNSDNFKIMKDPTIRFSKRLYSSFDVDVKKVKLRTPLKSLLARPEMYLREKVPQETYDTVVTLARTIQKWTIYEMLLSNLWLDAPAVVEFERNYGEALNDDDLYGIPPKKKVKRRGARKTNDSQQQGKGDFASEHTSVLSMEDVRESQLRDQVSAGKKSNPDAETIGSSVIIGTQRHLGGSILANSAGGQKAGKTERLPGSASTLPPHKSERRIGSRDAGNTKRTQGTLAQHAAGDNDSMMVEGMAEIRSRGTNFKNSGKLTSSKLLVTSVEARAQRYELYKLHLLKAEKDSHDRINRALAAPDPKYSVYSAQLEQLRKEIREDKNNFYTYSENYMSLSIDPYTEEEARRKQAEESKKKFLYPEGFKTVLPKPDLLNPSASEKGGKHGKSASAAPKPPSPELKLPTVGNPSLHKERFKSYFEKLEGGVFSKVEPLNKSENITAAEAQKRREEAKQREKEAFTKKLVVADPNFHVKFKMVGVKVTDKFRGLLEEEPKKPGYKLPAKYIKDKVVQRDEYLKPLPISFNLQEAKFADANRDKLFRLDRSFNPKESVAPTDFELIKIRSPTDYVNFPRKHDVFGSG